MSFFEPIPARPRARACMLAEFDHAESVWNKAAAHTAQGDPFCWRTEWQLSYHEAFAPDRQLFLREAGGNVLAFALRTYATVGTVLEPVEASWCFGCPLLGDGALELLLAVLDETGSPAHGAGVILSGLVPTSRLRSALLLRTANRFDAYRTDTTTQCTASLAGGMDGYWSRRSGHFRRRLQQAVRRAAERGVVFERHVPANTVAAAAIYQRMLAVERTSWKGIGNCGMTQPGSRAFYAAMLRRLASSRAARIVMARHDGKDIGFIFGGMCGEVYRGQQFSHAESWQKESIGNVLQHEQIRWLCEEGAARYDMGPLMEYKRHWTETQVAMETLLLRPTTRVARARTRSLATGSTRRRAAPPR